MNIIIFYTDDSTVVPCFGCGRHRKGRQRPCDVQRTDLKDAEGIIRFVRYSKAKFARTKIKLDLAWKRFINLSMFFEANLLLTCLNLKLCKAFEQRKKNAATR